MSGSVGMHAADDDVLALVHQGVQAVLGTESARAAVSFVGVDPVEILRFDRSGMARYVTLGMSRRPMTDPSDRLVAEAGPRAELMIRSRHRADGIRRQLAVLAAAPAVQGLVFGPDSTVDLGVALAPGSHCTGGLLVRSELEDIVSEVGPISILQLLPATPTELAWCRVHGAAVLRERWTARGTDLDDLSRTSVDLG